MTTDTTISAADLPAGFLAALAFFGIDATKAERVSDLVDELACRVSAIDPGCDPEQSWIAEYRGAAAAG